MRACNSQVGYLALGLCGLGLGPGDEHGRDGALAEPMSGEGVRSACGWAGNRWLIEACLALGV